MRQTPTANEHFDFSQDLLLDEDFDQLEEDELPLDVVVALELTH